MMVLALFSTDIIHYDVTWVATEGPHSGAMRGGGPDDNGLVECVTAITTTGSTVVLHCVLLSGRALDRNFPPMSFYIPAFL